MDISMWTDHTITSADEYAELQTALTNDLERQLSVRGLKLLRTLPNTFWFGAVAATGEGDRFLYVRIADVRDNPEWYKNVRLRRMSSERDWKGDEFHYCAWDEVGESAEKYLSPEYDDEIL